MGRHAREAWEVPRDLLLGRYPDFVTGGPLPKGQVPVFVFHSVEPLTFGAKLRYLADNGYVTLSADEYFQVLMGCRAAPDKAVVLTFDDGRGSLWSVGGPLLRRHGMCGIVFLVPGRMTSRPGPLPPTWEDQRSAEAASVLRREEGAGAFLSWEEVEALARSGVFDFESHTLSHARIHTGPTVKGFLTPAQQHGYAAFDVPLVHEGERDRTADELALGTPLLRSEPRTSEAIRFYEDPRIRDAPVERVAARGGTGFFHRGDWERELRGLIDGQGITGRHETLEEREQAIRHELLESKRLIEEHLGRPVLHLCYPWHAAGPTAKRLAREVGYRTAFCGKVARVPITLPGGDPHAVARVGEDYVELLPGRERASLATVLRRKWSRRMRGNP